MVVHTVQFNVGLMRNCEEEYHSVLYFAVQSGTLYTVVHTVQFNVGLMRNCGEEESKGTD